MICYKCDKCLSIHESLGEMTNIEFSHAGTASVAFPRNGKFLICNKCKGEFLKTLHAFSRVNNVDEAEAEDTTLIRVGDIVISDIIDKKREIVLGITTGVDGNPWASLYSQDYPVPQMMPISELKKTGEHIDVLGFFNNALKNTIKNAANIEENEVYIPVRSTLNPDRIESGSLNFETTLCEKCLVFAEYTPVQDYSIRFVDNTEVKKSWIMHMTEKQFKGMATGMAHLLGLEITGDKENDQV